MTISILVRDADSGAFGAVAATGSLCVGAWVLRGSLGAGLSASQGASPSTLWGEETLLHMQTGLDAQTAIDRVTGDDVGREYRQLTALDIKGHVGHFTGSANEPEKGSLAFDDGIAAGNMLANELVLPAMVDGFLATSGRLDQRLIAALVSAEVAGGDFRGLLSAALLILHPDQPPLSLRIDHHPTDPIGALGELLTRATTGAYASWARQVPVATDKGRVLD